MPYTGSKAQAGRGTVLAIGATPTPIGECTDSPLHRGEWQFDDVTNFDSGSDKETISTVRDNGTDNFKYNRVATDAGQIALEAAYASGAKTAFTLTLPLSEGQTTTGDKYTWDAFVKSLDFTIEPTKKIEGVANLMISGLVTYTAGS